MDRILIIRGGGEFKDSNINSIKVYYSVAGSDCLFVERVVSCLPKTIMWNRCRFGLTGRGEEIWILQIG